MRQITHTLNCTVRPRYMGLIKYPTPPRTAEAAPHFAAPIAAPRAASLCACWASALLSASVGVISMAWYSPRLQEDEAAA